MRPGWFILGSLKVWDRIEFHVSVLNKILGLSTAPICHKRIQFHSSAPGDLLCRDEKYTAPEAPGAHGHTNIIRKKA